MLQNSSKEKKERVQKQVEDHYKTLIEIGYNVVGVFLYGSQNYELDYSGSDVDTKAIILPTLEDIVLNRQPVSKTIDMGNGCLCDVKDIRKMFECFKKQNINFIELLFTKYYKLNPVYESMYKPMLDNAENIARYNNYASVNCMSGMALEKYNALTHPYPSMKEKIEKYGFDPKQLHHILRLKDFIVRYCNGEPYSQILVPKNKEELLKIKTDCDYSLEEAKRIAKETCDWMKEYKDNYMKNNPVFINKEVEELMKNTLTELITFSIKREVNAVMTLEELKDWTLSEYNERTKEQLDYYINERKCDVGDKAYLYSHENEKLTEMEIVYIIARSDDLNYYDSLDEASLIIGEEKYNADTSAEFITDNDCYLVWFRYV